MELSCSDRWTASKADRWTASEADLDGLRHCVPKKTCDHVFDDKLKQNCELKKNWHTYY